MVLPEGKSRSYRLPPLVSCTANAVRNDRLIFRFALIRAADFTKLTGRPVDQRSTRRTTMSRSRAEATRPHRARGWAVAGHPLPSLR
jgi:hypothetical protein